MYYFAYGSNLSTKRILKRCPSATVVCVASLNKFKLRFNKSGSDGSAKANIERTNSNNDVVHGVVYNIAKAEVAILDACEGEGTHYTRTTCRVVSAEGKRVKCSIYIAIACTEKDTQPYTWYLAHIVTGAKEHKLPENYCAALEAVTARKQVKKVWTPQGANTRNSDYSQYYGKRNGRVHPTTLLPFKSDKKTTIIRRKQKWDFNEPELHYDYSDFDLTRSRVSHDDLPYETFYLNEEQSLLFDSGILDDDELQVEIGEFLGLWQLSRDRDRGTERVDVLHVEGHVAVSYYTHVRF